MWLPPSSTSPRAARRYVRAVQEDADPGGTAFDPARCDDVDLVVSELVTNAVMHAGTDLELDAQVVDGELRLCVTDAAPGSPLRPGSAFDENGGAGLAIVARLATCWGIETADGTKTIWCHLPLR